MAARSQDPMKATLGDRSLAAAEMNKYA